ncbi:MAG: tetratricopeptide repeat protein, partial [Candidatus Aminicenantes bacterium]|nr:tetratricopeptide repeat protein [Candidatus Aminicenantes bacterium]
SVHYIGNTSVVKTFQDEHGLFFVHYSIQPQNLSVMGYKDKYYSNFLISGRVTDLDGKTVFQYNREYPIDFSKEQIKQVKMIPMAIQDSFPLVPGNYKFNLLLQNTVSKEFTSLEREIIIPESREAFWMGDLVFAFGEEKDKESLKSSFKVEETRLYPCLRKEFTPQDTLYLFFQLYGLSEELKEEGWIKYTFLIGEKQQYERKRKVVEYMDAMNFLEEFPLQDFPPSSYIIRVSVLDRDGREALFREERFSVLSKIHARPWIQFKRYPGSGDPVYSFTRGMQLLNKGEMEKAEEELRKAYEMDPEREDFAIAYAGTLLNRGANEDVKRMLMPFVEKQVSDDNLYYILGRAHQGLEEYEEAISFYQKFISHQGAGFVVLNSIGECYFQAENHREALRAWEKSLEINPDQPEIKKKVEGIKKKQ